MDAQLHAVRARDDVEAGVGETTASFEDFFREQYAGLYRALCLMTGSRLEAEEVLQEAFMKVFERWDRVVLMDNPAGYLFRVAINEFRSRYRRAARAARRAITFSRLDDAFAAVEDRDVVVRALKQLIPQQRAAIVLTSLLGYSSQEAGQILGMRPATVRALGTRARAAMRETVGETQ
jgi:RNA polymerase sigma-70 factor, ECF subfamily